MPFPTNLQTNEVKDAAGAEIEFLRFDSGQPRKIVFAKSGESPAYEHRLDVTHLETGTGLKRRRRSRLAVRIGHLSSVDNLTPVFTLGYVILDSPLGAITDFTIPTKCMANIMSVVASQGATTTILYDGTGYGAAALINGTL
jgi:hypothetical protein